VGFALYFHSYSTFLARRGLYLEDLFVRPAARGRGVGRALLAALAGIAVARACGRVEWSVLDWNEPAIRFYRSLGAEPMSEWTVFRVAESVCEARRGGIRTVGEAALRFTSAASSLTRPVPAGDSGSPGEPRTRASP
jgi:RimJ/RimL family protein N-acetyltransferase